jgi:ribosomal protein L37AE/L43A
MKSSQKNTPEKCPACKSSFVTDSLYSWICADCGATKESPVGRGKTVKKPKNS